MTAPGGPSLARVTVAAPTRRMDVALPDTMAVAELLPYLVRHADAGHLADPDTAAHPAGAPPGHPDAAPGGWVLRRATGTALEPQRNLAAQGVRDGELLHLSPARDDWPEPAYDDVVEVIAGGARRAARSWGGPATRRCGLAAAAAVLPLGLLGLALAGPPWPLPAAVALGVAAALLLGGTLLARAGADATAGAVPAAAGLPYAFAGGAWLLAPAGAGPAGAGAAGLLLGSALLVLAGVLGQAGVTALPRLFVAGTFAGLAGVLAALLRLAGISGAGAAAVALTVAVGMLPSYPVTAAALGRLPFPELPRRAEDILADRPLPRRVDVFAAVARAGEMLSGLLLGTAVTAVAAVGYLAVAGRGPAAIGLALSAAAALLLRARLLPTPAQRVPLLAAGLTGVALPAVAAAATGGRAAGLLLTAAAVAAAGAVLAAGLRYARRAPSPYLGRAADVADVLAIMALIPLACAVVGIFEAVRGLFAGMGG